MAIYLLDTSVVIDALNLKRGCWQLLKALVESGETLACCAMTVVEIYAGLLKNELGSKADFPMPQLALYPLS
jgi:predicted nucleic acid-binding protein